MEKFIKYLNDRNITYYDWNALSGDAEGKEFPADEMIDRVLKGVDKYDVSVVLLHDTNALDVTVELLPELEKNVTRNMIYLDYSVDGVNYDNALAYEATAGRWVGVKNGIFCCHVIPDKADVKETLAAGSGLEAGNSKEHACFSYFRIEGKNTEK